MTVYPRQPDRIVLTPSNWSPWYGWIDEGERFTRTQLYALGQAGLDASTVETIAAYREATQREMYWPKNEPPPVFQFDCPVIGHLKDGRVRVIAPSGESKIILGNGWVRQPSRLNLPLLAQQAASAMSEQPTAQAAEKENKS